MAAAASDDGSVKVENRFKQALGEGRPLVGFWAALASPLAAEVLANGDADWVLIDMEHGPSDVPALLAQLQAMAGGGAAALVRVPNHDPTVIKKVLDVGARTLLVPFVEDAAQAERLVRATRYPPEGFRGIATATRAAGFGRTGDYLRHANAGICVIVQIESAKGLDNVDAIAAVEGVDALFVGPADLSAALGHVGDPAHPRVEAAVAAILAAGARHGKPVGYFPRSPAEARARIAQGFGIVALGTDVQLLVSGAAAALATARGGAGDEARDPRR